MDSVVLDNFYVSLVEFLMLSKQQVIGLGNEFGLTAIQTLTLLLIDKDTYRAMSSFSTLLGCDASNVTGIVDGLEHKGLVSRREKPGDRRVKVVALEPKGTTARDAIITRLSSQNSYIISKLSSSEIREFTRMMQKITQGCPMRMMLEQTSAQPSSDPKK